MRHFKLEVSDGPRRFGVIAFGALLIAFAIPGCGFHPAGSRPLPEALRRAYIDVLVPYRVSETPLERSLRTRLIRQGANVLKESPGSSATIKVTNLKEGLQVLTVGPDGKAIEFLLVTTLDYEVINGTHVLVAPGSLRVTRDYLFDQTQVLAKEAEEADLREYIQDQMAELLLLRIETELSHHVVPDVDPTSVGAPSPDQTKLPSAADDPSLPAMPVTTP